jgi:TetR/AcrR family transcriptional regulator
VSNHDYAQVPVFASAREAILGASIDEFSRKGFAATRVDVIAESAGVNKQLIYYYFGSKAQLYDAVVDRMVQSFRPAAGPDDEMNFGQYFDAMSEQAFTSELSTWRRLLAWEGIEYGADENQTIRNEVERTMAYRPLVEAAKHSIVSGTLPATTDPRGIALLLIFASVLPDALPQVGKIITGLEPDDPALRARIRDTLRRLLMISDGADTDE